MNECMSKHYSTNGQLNMAEVTSIHIEKRNEKTGRNKKTVETHLWALYEHFKRVNVVNEKKFENFVSTICECFKKLMQSFSFSIQQTKKKKQQRRIVFSTK